MSGQTPITAPRGQLPVYDIMPPTVFYTPDDLGSIRTLFWAGRALGMLRTAPNTPLEVLDVSRHVNMLRQYFRGTPIDQALERYPPLMVTLRDLYTDNHAENLRMVQHSGFQLPFTNLCVLDQQRPQDETIIHEILHYVSGFGGLGEDLTRRFCILCNSGNDSAFRFSYVAQEGGTEYFAQRVSPTNDVGYDSHTATFAIVAAITGERAVMNAFLTHDYRQVQTIIDRRLGQGAFEEAFGADTGVESFRSIWWRVLNSGDQRLIRQILTDPVAGRLNSLFDYFLPEFSVTYLNQNGQRQTERPPLWFELGSYHQAEHHANSEFFSSDTMQSLSVSGSDDVMQVFSNLVGSEVCRRAFISGNYTPVERSFDAMFGAGSFERFLQSTNPTEARHLLTQLEDERVLRFSSGQMTYIDPSSGLIISRQIPNWFARGLVHASGSSAPEQLPDSFQLGLQFGDNSFVAGLFPAFLRSLCRDDWQLASDALRSGDYRPMQTALDNVLGIGAFHTMISSFDAYDAVTFLIDREENLRFPSRIVFRGQEAQLPPWLRTTFLMRARPDSFYEEHGLSRRAYHACMRNMGRSDSYRFYQGSADILSACMRSHDFTRFAQHVDEVFGAGFFESLLNCPSEAEFHRRYGRRLAEVWGRVASR